MSDGPRHRNASRHKHLENHMKLLTHGNLAAAACHNNNYYEEIRLYNSVSRSIVKGAVLAQELRRVLRVPAAALEVDRVVLPADLP